MKKLTNLTATVLCFALWTVTCFAAQPESHGEIVVSADEQGDLSTGLSVVYHDPSNQLTLSDIHRALLEGKFEPLQSAGSSGLKPGSFWTYFALRNPTSQALSLHLEYIDHQLINLVAYQLSGRSGASELLRQPPNSFQQIVDLSMTRPFDHRQIKHNRFVVPITIPAQQTAVFLVQMSSAEVGYVFPSMRIWSPEQLSAQHTKETALIAFLFGGFFIMAIFALVGGIATREHFFYAYAIYSLSKITVWATILGFTHQYVLQESFRWQYMSISGAITIICGLVFARLFLQTRQYTRKIDLVLLFMIANAVLLLTAALFQIKVLAIITITIALLLYPFMIVAGLVRWRQGSWEAGIFSLAWSLLVCGLFVQALRDLGVVEHNLFNYYWPPFASFSEMLTILAAMGIKIRRLRLAKQDAERKYRQQLEESKRQLEFLVDERTQALQGAIAKAEYEANTDHLTAIHNRRSFINLVTAKLEEAYTKKQPVSLLLFDIDHFKGINDQFGHTAGDRALITFSRTITAVIRHSDIFARLGGEEFGLLVNESPAAALQTAERLRCEIEALQMSVNEKPLRLTVSIGVAHATPGTNFDDLMHQADDALYNAKGSGRNRVIPAEKS